MKRILIPLSLVFIILLLNGCVPQEEHITGTPMLKVILNDYAEQKNEKTYFVVDNKGNAEKTDAFVPNSHVTTFYQDTSMYPNLGAINVLPETKIKVKDKNGKSVNADKTTIEIMRNAANTIDHDIFDFSLWCIDDKYFVFLKLNVNLQEPCILYYYNTAKKELTELYSWQSMDLVGISTNFD